MDFGFGYLGVHAFFVLSGYLITPILIKTKLNTPSLRAFLVNFYGRRALRIFPPYYVYLIVILLIIFGYGLQNDSYFLRFINQLPWTITYTYDFYHASAAFQHSTLVSHFWSLAVEEQFYIFWPFVIYFISEAKLKRAFILFILFGPVIRLLTGFIVDNNILNGLGHSKNIIIYVSPFSHIDAFVIGSFFSVYLRKFTPSSTLILSSSIAIVLIGLVTSKIFSDGLHLKSLGYAQFMNDSFKYLWGYTLFSFYFGMLLLRLNKRNFIPVIFENNIIAYLGKISYGLYIYHYAIIEWVTFEVNHINNSSYKYHINNIYIPLFSLGLSIVISVISFEVFEKFTLAWKDRFFPKRADGVTQAS